MIRPVLRLGEPVLRGRARPVVGLTPDIADLVSDLVDTMHHAPGIGLAAPQIGVDLRVFVVDLSVGRSRAELRVFINPEVVARDGLQLAEEGCLSVPGFHATVARPARLVVRGLDLTGRPVELAADGLLARALQHELDHLDGRLFVDRLPSIQRWAINRDVQRRRKRGRW